MPSPIISIDHLSKIYQTGDIKVKALANVSLQVAKGEFVAIMGSSGSGKSTLMHIMGALDKPTNGTYLLDGRDVAALSDDELAEIRNKKIGFVFQAFNLLPRTSAIDNVKLPMEYAQLPERTQTKRAREVLKMVGLADRMDYPPHKLSGGQQQRVAIARALVMEPSIILADEPTGNIASVQASEVMAIFQRLNQKGHTIIMITHEEDIAEHAQRIIYLFDGQIRNDGRGHRQRLVKLKNSKS
jgi:putative ABC transport system ATP-binding protein